MPSSSLLSSEKKFGSTESGWHRDTIRQMREVFEQKGIERGRHGILSFDEVKIREGIVYDPHTGTFTGKITSQI